MVTISKLTVKELSVFINDTSLSDRDVLPLSRLRAISFMANPRADSDDIVVYLAYSNDELIGYRTVLPDIIYVKNLPYKVAWLSGAWVHPDFRRQGISSELLEAITTDWEQRVLTANFALNAKMVYDKSNKFETLTKIQGSRFYLKTTFLESYNCCKQSNPFKLFAEKFINAINITAFTRSFLKLPKGVELEYYHRPDDELCSLFEQSNDDTLTRRSRIEWNWILRFPWMLSAPLGDRVTPKYFFASAPIKFNQFVIKVFYNGNLVGMLHMQHSHTRLTVPYSFFEPDYSRLMAKIVLLHAVKQKATFITLYNSLLISGMNLYRVFFLYKTRRYREFLATKYLVGKLQGKKLQFSDGDGDCAFI